MNAVRPRLATYFGHVSHTTHDEESHPIRTLAIATLWILIAAIVLYLAWIAHVQTTGVPAPPWFLPIA